MCGAPAPRPPDHVACGKEGSLTWARQVVVEEGALSVQVQSPKHTHRLQLVAQ
jgi:hypothetical protein